MATYPGQRWEDHLSPEVPDQPRQSTRPPFQTKQKNSSTWDVQAGAILALHILVLSLSITCFKTKAPQIIFGEMTTHLGALVSELIPLAFDHENRTLNIWCGKKTQSEIVVLNTLL